MFWEKGDVACTFTPQVTSCWSEPDIFMCKITTSLFYFYAGGSNTLSNCSLITPTRSLWKSLIRHTKYEWRTPRRLLLVILYLPRVLKIPETKTAQMPF